MAQKKFETVVQKSNKIAKGTILELSVSLLNQDGIHFEAKEKYCGTIFYCTLDEKNYDILKKNMYSGKYEKFMLVEQDTDKWTAIKVSRELKK